MESSGIHEKHNLTLDDHIDRSNFVAFEDEEKKARQRMVFLETNYAKMEA